MIPGGWIDSTRVCLPLGCEDDNGTSSAIVMGHTHGRAGCHHPVDADASSKKAQPMRLSSLKRRREDQVEDTHRA